MFDYSKTSSKAFMFKFGAIHAACITGLTVVFSGGKL